LNLFLIPTVGKNLSLLLIPLIVKKFNLLLIPLGGKNFKALLIPLKAKIKPPSHPICSEKLNLLIPLVTRY
jgi:hypothetical protein